MRKFTIEEYARAVGVEVFSEQVGVSRVSMYQFMKYEIAPAPHTADRIIKASNGAISYESIYKNFVDNNPQKSFDGV